MLHLAQGNGGKALFVRLMEVVVDVEGVKGRVCRSERRAKAEPFLDLLHEGE